MASVPTDVASAMEVSCAATSSLALYVVVCLLGLAVAFSGYQMYRRFIMLLGFVLFGSVELGIGRLWVGQASGDELTKWILVLVFCAVWGSIGAFIFSRYVEKFQRVVGFAMGAALGLGLLSALIFSLTPDVDAMLGPDYRGWDGFMLRSLSLPVALLFGYLLMDMLKYGIMLVTAVGGSAAALGCVITLLQCCEEVELGAVSEQKVQAVLIAVLALLAFLTQVFTDPERRSNRDGARAGPCMV